MINTRDLNIQMIATVAKRLGNLREKVVFVGGCATGLFIADSARFTWHEVSKVAHYWLEVNAMTRPMQVREEIKPYGENIS
jgi:hypothetical protein